MACYNLPFANCYFSTSFSETNMKKKKNMEKETLAHPINKHGKKKVDHRLRFI